MEDMTTFKHFLKQSVNYYKGNKIGFIMMDTMYQKTANFIKLKSTQLPQNEIEMAEAVLLFTRGEQNKILARKYLAKLSCYTLDNESFLIYNPSNYIIKEAYYKLKKQGKNPDFNEIVKLLEKKFFPTFNKVLFKRRVKEVLKKLDFDTYVTYYVEDLFDFADTF